MIKSILFMTVLVGGFSLAQYEKSQTKIEYSDLKEYTIINIKKPLYVMVNLKDQENTEYNDNYVRKFCDRWKEIPMNGVVKLPTVIKTRGEKHWTEIDASSLCPSN